MTDRIRDLLQTRAGMIAALGAVAIALYLGVSSLAGVLGSSPAAALSRHRLFICAETGKSFQRDVSTGAALPVTSPYSGARSGYPAELCYWTLDGGIRQEPTPVLLNSYVGRKGPTFCTDCDRLVRAWNPRPVPGEPPPTRAQLETKRARTALGKLVDE